LNRRKFLGLSASAGTALLLPVNDVLASIPKPAFTMNKDFELKILATNWGFNGTLEQYCSKAKAEGYNGIEIWWPAEKNKQDELFECLKRHQLDVGFLCGASQSNFQEHLDAFKKAIDAAAQQTIQRPLFINCHSGRDHFSFEQNKAFIDHTTRLAKESGVKICHETHRSRIMFAAHTTRQFIEKIPELRLTLDISHWCNVHESLLQDQQQTVQMVLERVDHIHARIGHPEGPQVNDPRAPEWASAVKQHFEWWDKVVENKKRNGERMTFLTEFGPPDYMPALPYSRQPVADQWAINVHMMQLLRKRYS
jgi:sugar phosphate isomerase/epimerase